MVHIALSINLTKKQLTSMFNPTTCRKLSRKSQGQLKKDYPADPQQREYLKIRIFENSNSTMSSVKSKGYLQKINYTKENDGTNSKCRKCNILRFYTANQPKLMSVNISFG